MKLLSILLLSYNNLDRVYGTLDSIFRQDYPCLELVLADDASADYAAAQPRVAAYIEAHRGPALGRVRWVSHPENVGTVRNMNDAIRASEGEYLFSLSPEDELAHESVLTHLVETLEETGRGICFGRMRGVTPEGRTVDHLLSCESDYDLLKSYTVEQTRNRLFSRNFLPAPAKIMTRRLLEENGLYPESIRLIEDYPYWLTLTKNGVPFAYLDEVVLCYRLSGISSTGHYSEAFMEDMFKIYDEFIFPYDRRFGPLQGVYNLLKRHGLQFYMAKARWPRLSPGKRLLLRVRYLPFFCYTSLLDRRVARKNRKDRKSRA
ncbi:MAG: glycosyltransferase [Clostridia bacterium]|nr:glycosyltransferase [Clostridia bacterium]